MLNRCLTQKGERHLKKSNIMTTNSVKNQKVVEMLNELLADLQVVYQNLRTMHWLVKGSDFYMLHKLYEEYYNQTAEQVDEVAERVLMLGGTPLHTYTDYLKTAKVAVVTEVPAGKVSLKVALAQNEHLLNSYRAVLSEASANGDEGTVALMSDFIGSTEKQVWMLQSTLA